MRTWSCRVCWLRERIIVYIIALLVLQRMTKAWLFWCVAWLCTFQETRWLWIVFPGFCKALGIIHLRFSDCKHLGQIFILFETIYLLISVCLIFVVNDKCHLSYLAFSPYLLILCLWNRCVRIMCCELLNTPYVSAIWRRDNLRVGVLWRWKKGC